MNTVFPFILGLLLRLGIPVGLSILMFMLLRKLDSRWQKEAVEIKILPPQTPCWELKGCPEEKQKSCKAYIQKEIPCWQVFRARDGMLQEKCLDCAVFQLAPTPVS